MERFNFPPWVNKFLPVLGALVLLGGGYAASLLAYGAHPHTTNVGYRPVQPVPFSHKLHAGKLKMDCRYCHNTVEHAARAAVPPTGTCTNCHSGADASGQVPTTALLTDSLKLLPVRQSQNSGKPIPWVRVHDLPDYAYFDHSAHVNNGVSCVSCHGRVDRMDVVQTVENLSMGWCLECHRNPEPHLRPLDQITNLAWEPESGKSRLEVGAEMREKLKVDPPTHCSGCHR